MQRRSLTVLPILVFVLTLLMAAPAWAQAELSVDKRDSPDPVVEGEILTYTIEVENTTEPEDPADPLDTAQDVELVDDLDPRLRFVSVNTTAGDCTAPDPGDANGTVTCDLGDLEPGESATVTIRVRPRDTWTIPNEACAESATAVPTEVCDDVTTTVLPDVEIRKLDDPDPASTEDLLLYTLRVTNEGEGDAANIVIRDDLPLSRVDFVTVESSDFECDFTGGLVRCEGPLPADETGTVEIVVEPEEAGTIQNSASVSAEGRRLDAVTTSTVVENRNSGGGTGGGGTTTGGTTTGAVSTAQTTTPETTTSDTTTADAQSADDLRAGDDVRAAGFSCVEIVDISQSASRNQYNFSSARLQECLAREVIDDVKGDRLADTGGAPLLPIAASLLAGVGIFVGRALVSRRLR